MLENYTGKCVVIEGGCPRRFVQQQEVAKEKSPANAGRLGGRYWKK